MATKPTKPADASTAQVASTEAPAQRSFPWPFGSQEAHRRAHQTKLVLDSYRNQDEAFSDESAREALDNINRMLIAQGKSGIYMVQRVADEIGLPLGMVESLSFELAEFKEGWPSNKDKVASFIKRNVKHITKLEGKTEFDALK